MGYFGAMVTRGMSAVPALAASAGQWRFEAGLKAALAARRLAENPDAYDARATAPAFSDRPTSMGTTMLVSRSKKSAHWATRLLRRRLLARDPGVEGTRSA
jgi:hypothetical protein